MILQRLYEFAQRENLLTDPAFIRTPIACLVVVDRAGEYRGLLDLRKREEISPKRKGGQAKVRLTGGRDLQVPIRPVVWDETKKRWKTTDPAASGKEKPAVFLADTLARVLPLERLIDDKDRAKLQAQRSTFWRFLKYAANQTQDEALGALAALSDHLTLPELQDRMSADAEQHKLSLADLCSFTWDPDRGKALLERPAIRDWWRQFYETDFQAQQEGQYRGWCQVTGQITAISSSIKSKINGLMPIGCRAEAYLVTGLQAAESYNLAGAAAGMVSPAGVDGFTRGLNALIGNEVKGLPTSVRVGNVLFVFWTRNKGDAGIMTLFEPTEAEVKALFASPHAGKEYHGLADANNFFLLVLSANSARVVVRDYLETPLSRIQENLQKWFRDLTIASTTKDGAGHPTSMFPLWPLVAATALEIDRVAPDTSSLLVHSALKGDPLPLSVLAACLGRLRAEGSDGFRAARMALIKLTLLRRNILVKDTLNPNEQNAAYVCGRLMCVFEQIQYAALRDVNATVTDKFFGTFSAAPAMVLGRLYANAQNHLRKVRVEKPKSFVALDKLLAEVSAKLPEPPTGQLSLFDQGRFALGYYHQKAKRFADIAERKAARAGADSEPETTE